MGIQYKQKAQPKKRLEVGLKPGLKPQVIRQISKPFMPTGKYVPAGPHKNVSGERERKRRLCRMAKWPMQTFAIRPAIWQS